MSDKEIEEIWQLGRDIPIDESECIEEKWYIWTIGTDRIDIWQWFDRNHSKGLAYIMYGEYE